MSPTVPIVPLSFWATVAINALLIVFGAATWVGIMALLDRPNWRHALHLWTHKECGRCQEEASARWHDRQFDRADGRALPSTTHGGRALPGAVHGPSEAIDG